MPLVFRRQRDLSSRPPQDSRSYAEAARGARPARPRRRNDHFQRPQRSLNTQVQHPIPSEFFDLTKSHFVLLKATHHLASLRRGLPPSLVKRSEILAASLRPAFMDDFFAAELESITSVWNSSVLEALRKHYNALIEDATARLSSKPMPPDVLEASVRLVTRWGRSQLGRKLSDLELDEALSLIYQSQALTNEPSAPVLPAPEGIPQARTNSKSTCTQSTQTPAPVEEDSQPPVPARRTVRTQPCVDLDSSGETSAVTDGAPRPSVVDETLSNTVPQDSGFVSRSDPPTVLRQTQLLAPDSFVLNSSVSEEPSRPVLFDSPKSAVIFGDSNFLTFEHDECSVFANSKGRLSFFKNSLQSISTVFHNVLNCIFCLFPGL